MANSLMPPTFLASAICARLKVTGFRTTVFFGDDVQTNSVVLRVRVRKRESEEERTPRIVLAQVDFALSLDELMAKLEPMLAGLALDRPPDGPVSCVELEEEG